MYRLQTVTFFLLCALPFSALAEEPSLTRAEGFALLWQSLQRPIETTSEKPFDDIKEGDLHFALLTYAKSRNFFPERDRNIEPHAPLKLKAGLVWLFRTRNVAYPDDITETNIQTFLRTYPLLDPSDMSDDALMSREQLNAYSATLDNMLKKEHHTVSYYGEDFAGRNTAFGEIFDPNALTAAHRTFPHNTLVRVTNTANESDVVVRINDRGPYVDGRDMDLSRAAFDRIAALSSGVIDGVMFERLGNAEVVEACPNVQYQKRLGSTLLTPGIPRIIATGTTIALSADTSFRMIQMRAPGRRVQRSKEWTAKGEELSITFDREGIYTFVLHEDSGKRRRFRTKVIGSCP